MLVSLRVTGLVKLSSYPIFGPEVTEDAGGVNNPCQKKNCESEGYSGKAVKSRAELLEVTGNVLAGYQ